MRGLTPMMNGYNTMREHILQKKHVDNHISLADAIRASDDLVAERRSILTNKLADLNGRQI